MIHERYQKQKSRGTVPLNTRTIRGPGSANHMTIADLEFPPY
jgi:hypothetical protein